MLPKKKLFNNFSESNIKCRAEKFISFLNYICKPKLIPKDDYVCKFLEISSIFKIDFDKSYLEAILIYNLTKDETIKVTKENETQKNIIQEFILEINNQPDNLCKFVKSFEEKILHSKLILDQKEIDLLLFVSSYRENQIIIVL